MCSVYVGKGRLKSKNAADRAEINILAVSLLGDMQHYRAFFGDFFYTALPQHSPSFPHSPHFLHLLPSWIVSPYFLSFQLLCIFTQLHWLQRLQQTPNSNATSLSANDRKKEKTSVFFLLLQCILSCVAPYGSRYQRCPLPKELHMESVHPPRIEGPTPFWWKPRSTRTTAFLQNALLMTSASPLLPPSVLVPRSFISSGF